MIDFGEIRAGLLEMGADPRAAGEMELYEIFSMFAKMAKPKDALMTDEQFEAAKDRWRKMNLPDVRI